MLTSLTSGKRLINKALQLYSLSLWYIFLHALCLCSCIPCPYGIYSCMLYVVEAVFRALMDSISTPTPRSAWSVLRIPSFTQATAGGRRLVKPAATD